MAGELTPESLLSLPPQIWDFKLMTSAWLFSWLLQIEAHSHAYWADNLPTAPMETFYSHCLEILLQISTS